MKLDNNKIKLKLIIPIVIIILFFYMPANFYVSPKLFPDVAKTAWEMNTYPSLHYEKQFTKYDAGRRYWAFNQKRKGV
jgi:hypothetical protein